MYSSNWRMKLAHPLRNSDLSKQMDDKRRLIIEISGKRTDKIMSLIEANHGKIHHEIHLLPSFVVELPGFSLEELAHFQYVKRIWYDAPVFIRLDAAVPSVGGLAAQQLGYTGKGVVIAVLDTGIYPHRDLTSPRNRILAWNDLVNRKTIPYDDHGHGTHVAGIIAGNGRTSRKKYLGMAPEAMLVGVKIMDAEGNGSVSNVISGIEWCLDNTSSLNIRVINLSLGSPAQGSCRFDPLCRAVGAAWRKGITVCAAAGNEGPGSGTIDSPGISPEIITVGNLDDRQTLTGADDLLNQSSGRGPTIDQVPKPDLIAPGTNITSLKVHGGYRSLTGTSMSTPMVAGAVAQIIQKWPSLKPDQIKRLLTKNARDLGLGRNLQGTGCLDLGRILKVNTTKQNMNPLLQILGYHMTVVASEKMGIGADLIKRKRDETLQKTLLAIFAKSIGNSLVHQLDPNR